MSYLASVQNCALKKQAFFPITLDCVKITASPIEKPLLQSDVSIGSFGMLWTLKLRSGYSSGFRNWNNLFWGIRVRVRFGIMVRFSVVVNSFRYLSRYHSGHSITSC